MSLAACLILLTVSVLQCSAVPEDRVELTRATQGLQADESPQHDQHDRAVCPEGWKRYGTSCYGIGDAPVTWGSALEICNRLGAVLVEVESPGENEFLQEIAKSRGYETLWLGSTDMFNEGHFEWINSRRLIRNVGYTDWLQGEPNNNFNEDCLMLFKPANYKWIDGHCTSHANFACEVKL